MQGSTGDLSNISQKSFNHCAIYYWKTLNFYRQRDASLYLKSYKEKLVSALVVRTPQLEFAIWTYLQHQWLCTHSCRENKQCHPLCQQDAKQCTKKLYDHRKMSC